MSLRDWYVCSIVRFRWIQARRLHSSVQSPAVSWALDNVYVGMQCAESHCSGHGTCVSGMFCLCDDRYTGDQCATPHTPLPNFLKEDFEGSLYLYVLYFAIKTRTSMLITKHGWTTRQNALTVAHTTTNKPYYKNAR